MKDFKDTMMLAQEWADKIASIKGVPQYITAEECAWGFNEVLNGRHPNIVLNNIIERIEARRPKPIVTIDGDSQPSTSG